MGEKGSIHLSILFLLIFLVSVGTVIINSQYLHPEVKGVLIAKDESSSGGSSDSGSHDSGSSGGSSGGSSSDSSSGGGSSNSGSQNSNTSTNTSSGSQNNTSNGSSIPITPSKTENETKTETRHIERKIEASKAEKEVKIETKTEAENTSDLENEVENEVEKPEVKEVEVAAKQGEIEVEAKEASSASNQKKSTKNLSINLTKNKGEKQIKLAAEGEKIEIASKGVTAESKFPLSVNKQTGQLFVRTGKGLREIRILPNQAAEIASLANIENQIDKIELIENELPNIQDDILVKISGKKNGNLAGFIPISTSVETEIGAQTGDIVKVSEPIWLRLLSKFIF